MIVVFGKEYLEELYVTGKSDKKHRFQPDIVKRYKQKIDYLKQANNIEELFLLKSLNYEVLSGDKKGVSSIRVNDQYRIEFIVETTEEPIRFFRNLVETQVAEDHFSFEQVKRCSPKHYSLYGF